MIKSANPSDKMKTVSEYEIAVRRAAEKLMSVDQQTFIRVAHDLEKQAAALERNGFGESHPLAALAGAFKDLPGWEEDKAERRRMRDEPAAND